MKRILIAAALCLVSFQSYAESEMTFIEFGAAFFSEDQSAYFMRYANTAVAKQDLGGTALNYSAGKYGDANGFRDACLAKCAGEEKCGGVVFQYYKTDKKTPKKCALKKLEPTTKTNKQKKKDFYRRVCYDGGPGGYLNPYEYGSSNPVICRMFGKNVVELADGSFIVKDEPPVTVEDEPSVTVEDEPSVTEKLQSDLGTPWVPGKMKMNDSPCWCITGQCLSYPARRSGTASKSWIAGNIRFTASEWIISEDEFVKTVRRELSRLFELYNRVLPDLSSSEIYSTKCAGAYTFNEKPLCYAKCK